MHSHGARIAMVSMRAPCEIDGLDVLLHSIAAEIAKRGVSVDLLTRAQSRPIVRELSDGVVLHELAAGPASPVPLPDLLGLTDAFGEAVAELAGRTGARYDVIHAFGWQSGLACLPVALELGVPLVQTFLAPEPAAASDAHGVRPRPRGEMFLANQAGAIIAGAASEVTTLIDELHAPADRIWVIPPGVDVGFFRPERARTADDELRSEMSIAPDRPIIAVVGHEPSFDDRELAVRSLSELHSLRGWAPVLVIIDDAESTDAAGSDDLLALATRLGVAGEVRFTGPLSRERLADLLAVATVTVVPSRTETFGLIGLESAASGTPVVGFRGATRTDSVSQGTSGLLVDSRDPREWARTITELLDDQVTLDGLSASARHHAEGFTWAATATALLGVYASLGAQPVGS